MRAMYDLRKTLCGELEKIADKREISAGDLEAAHKLTDTIKNIDKIIKLNEPEYSYGYSNESSYMDRDLRRTSGNYDKNYSGRQHYVRGHYSRGLGYSRADAKESMMSQLESMLNDASNEKERDAIRRCMSQMESE